MRKFNKFILSSAFMLGGCGLKLNEVYDYGQYINGADFTKIFFTGHNDLAGKKKNSQTIVLENKDYCNGIRGISSKTKTPSSVDFSPFTMVVKEGETKVVALGGELSLEFNISPLQNKYDSKTPVTAYLNKEYSVSYSLKAPADKEVSLVSFASSSSHPEILDVRSASLPERLFFFTPKGEGEATITIQAEVKEGSNLYSLSNTLSVSLHVLGGPKKGFGDRYPEAFQNKDGSYLSADPLTDWNLSRAGLDDSSYIGKSFGRTKCMSKRDEGYKKGFLSRLYDGQMYCEGYHSRALVCLDKNGFSTLLPGKIDGSEYFLVSMRGGSNDDTGSNHNAGSPRYTSFDLSLDLYMEAKDGYDSVSITAKDVVVQTDSGGEACTFFGFKFAEVAKDIDLAKVVGYGISYDNWDDRMYAYRSEESCDGGTQKKYAWGLLLYELMFI